MDKINRVKIADVWGYDRLYPILQDAFRVLYISYQIVIPSRQKNKYLKKKGTPLENNFTDDLVKNTTELPKILTIEYKNNRKISKRTRK